MKRIFTLFLLAALFVPLAANAQTCEISYALVDSYGDGWNGGSLVITDVTASSQLANLTISSGSSLDGTVLVTDGHQISFAYTPGSWASENSWVIRDVNGAAIWQGGGGDGSQDYTWTAVCPSCLSPTNVTASNPTSHGATISWTGESDSYIVMVGQPTIAGSYDFETGSMPSAFTNDASRPWSVVANTHSGAYCVKSAGGFTSTNSDLSLTVNLAAAGAVSFSALVSSESGWDFGRFLIDGNQQFESSGTSNSWTDYSYTLTAGSHTLTWRYYKDGSGNNGDDCFYVDDIVINMEPAWDETHTATTSPYTFTDLDPETSYQVKVKGICDGELSDPSATVSFTTDVACPVPTDFHYTDLTSSSVRLEWESDGDRFQLHIAQGENPDPNAYQQLGATGNKYWIIPSGLTANTTYTVKLVRHCTEETPAVFSTPVYMTFTTLESCPVPVSLATNNVTAHGATLTWMADNDSYNIRYAQLNPVIFLSEGFEGGSMPEGWTQEGNGTWTVGAGNDDNSTTITTAHTGNYNAKATHSNSSYETYLITPAMDLSTVPSATISLWYTNETWPSDTDGFGVYYRVDGGAWNELFYTNTQHASWTEIHELELPNLAANYQIGFLFEDNYGYGVTIDDIEIVSLSVGTWQSATSNTTSYSFTGLDPETTYTAQVQGVCSGEPTDWSETVSFTTTVACPAPTNLVAGTPDAHTVALSWTETGGATAWQICLNGDEENLVDVTERDVTITGGVVAYTLTGLISETDYTVKVRANCGGEDGVSSWSNTVSFTTAIGCPAPTNLTVSNIEPNSATVSWEGTANSHNLRYRTLEETDMVTVILTTGDVWGDGSGYQMLLDADATAYGTIISDALHIGGDVSDEVYAQFEYKIPTNADGSLTTSNIVVNNSIAITIFPGTYDWCITNPTPGDNIYIAASNGNISGSYDNYVFEAGKTYEFEVVKIGTGDGVNLTITDTRATNVGDWIVLNDVTSPQTLSLSDGAFYQVEVQGTCDDNEESKWVTKYFETPSNCTAPEALLVSDLDFSSATLSWTGLHDSYNLQYRTAAHRQTFFFEDFDGQPDTWTISNCSWWIPSSASPDYFCGVGYDQTGVTAYMISPELPAYAAGSVVEFIQRHNGTDVNFQVGFSSTTNDYDAFTWGDEVAATSSLAPYSEVIPDGIKYIAIRVSQEEGSSANIFVNNFGVYSATVPAGEWTIVERVTSPYELTDIVERTAYEWQVQGIYETCDGGVTEWSEMSTFTTPAACADPTGLVVSDISVHSAVITWVPGEATQTAWQICINDDEEHPIDLTETIYNMTELTEETNYVVKVRGNCDANGYSEWMSYEFTTLSSCDFAPWNLTADDVTATTATLSWEGYKDYYDVKYYSINTTVFAAEDFENGEIPSTFTNDDTYPWTIVEGEGNNYIQSSNAGNSSTSSTISISVTLTEDGTIEFDAECMGEGSSTYYDHCDFYIDDTRMLYHGADLGSGWNHYSYELTAGTHTLTWSYTKDSSVNPTGDYFAIDNIVVSAKDITLAPIVENVAGNTYTLTGLTPETEYEVQVRGTGCGDDVWSESVTFTTLEQTTLTQTVTLTAGMNWFSTYVEITLDDLKAALVAALPGTLITINSQTQSTTYNGSRWRGTLNALDVTQMYIIDVTVDCEITLEGMPIDPAEHPVTIKNGMNWIAFPFNADMAVANAFAGFAVSGDEVISRTQSTAYNGSRWRGTLSNLAPGQGFIYKSNAADVRVFTFPTAK